MRHSKTGSLKALAVELKLSVTTISRALAGYSDVASATRERVCAAATEMGYVPNSAARSLVTGRSGFIGLLLPLRDAPVIDPFLGETVAGLSEGLTKHQSDLFMASVPAAESELAVLKHVVESGRADGLVLTRIAERDARVAYLIDRQFPFITHGRTLDEATHHWIDTDGRQAFADVFHWLYGLGHRRFALLSIAEPMTFRKHREQGFAEAIRQANDADVTSITVRVPRFDSPATIVAVQDLLCGDNPPTAIVALTDELALHVLEQATALNITVPDELSVVGFDNLPAARFATPALTTFDQSIRHTACQMAGMLLAALDDHGHLQQKLTTPTLIKRGSHGPVPCATRFGACLSILADNDVTGTIS